MNNLQLCQRLRQEAGIAGNGPATTVDQPGELGRIVNWISQAYEDIQNNDLAWRFLRWTFTLPLTYQQSTYSRASYNTVNFINAGGSGITPGQTVTQGNTTAIISLMTITSGALNTNNAAGYYTISYLNGYLVPGTLIGASGTLTSTLSPAVKNWKQDSLRIYTDTTNFTDELWLPHRPWELFRDNRLRGASRNQKGRPIEFSIDPQKEIVVWPTPDNQVQYYVTGEYYQIPDIFLSDASIPNFDTNHMAIVYNALMRYADYVGEPSLFAFAQQQYGRLIGKLENDWAEEIQLGGALA